MHKFLAVIALLLVCTTVQAQQYSSAGGIEANYKGKYEFKVRLDEVNKTLSFETDAPVSVVTLETYTQDERIARKGKEYTDIYFTKRGNVYTYDLTRPELTGMYAYWLKVSTGRNGSPLAEYYFQRRTAAPNMPEEAGAEEKNDAGETIIRTNATCPEGKTKLTTALKSLDGVRRVSIDPRGTVFILYSNDGTPFNDLLTAINENGFTANNRPATNASANPCGKTNRNTVSLTPNILDATPGYKKTPVKFVPIKPDYSKGYSDTKMYNWVDDVGNRHSGTGKEILDEINQLEEQLNLRGHSLRDKNAFDGLTFPLNSMSKNDFTKCAIVNKLKQSGKPDVPKIGRIKKLKNITIVQNMVASTVYSYLGYITTGAEFREANMNSSMAFTRSGNDATADMQLVFQPAMYQKLKTCLVEVAETPKGNTLFSTTVDLKKAASLNAAQAKLNFGDAVEPQHMASNYTIFSYPLRFINAASKLPPETCTPKPYYLTLKFYDAQGKLTEIYQPNDLVLNNQLPLPLNIPKQGGKSYAGYEYEFLDPGLHCFGFYAESNGYTAGYFSHGQGYTGDERRASVNANMEIGVKYYNWNRLIDKNAPLTKSYALFGYDIRSEEKYTRPDNCLPPIRQKGYKKEDPDHGVVSLIGNTYNLSTTNENYFSKSIEEQIASVDFFIGPVPCNIAVSISGTVSMQVDYQSNYAYCDAKTTVSPHADITLHGSGGVDAKIMYAKVFADVKLLEIDMPYTLEASNTNGAATIDPLLKVGGLSGEVYFKAGFCIPIPLVDDLCESFRIDILNWKGFEKKFTVDPKKGISL